MKLRSINARKGFTIPTLANMRPGQPVLFEDVVSRGWKLYRRGPTLLFEAPAKDGAPREVYERHVEDFDLNWTLEPGETLESMTRWDSHPATEAKKK